MRGVCVMSHHDILYFTKSEVNGNDFIIFNNQNIEYSSNFIRYIADRKFGIGADQIIDIKQNHDKYIINFYNQDGSSAMMCGNGLCASLQVLHPENPIKIIVNNTEILGTYSPKSDSSKIELPLPMEIIMSSSGIIENDYIIDHKFIDTSNRHMVCLVDNRIDDLQLISTEYAKSLQDIYPDFNIHFIKMLDHDIYIRSFERGVGWTLACGSGSIASTFAFGHKNRIHTIHHERGTSIVNIHDEIAEFETSPNIVFEGKFRL